MMLFVRSFGLVLLLLISISACGVLTVERIDGPSPPDLQSSKVEQTPLAFDAELGTIWAHVHSNATQASTGATQIALLNTQVAYLSTRRPAPLSTASPLPPATYLVVGAMEIEQGRCCVGGIAGEIIEIHVHFSASGTEAPVLAMRYTAGSYSELDEDLDAFPWLPFTERITFPYRVPINWTGFYVQVQFRDALGNTSPLYTGDISVEGMPPITPGSP